MSFIQFISSATSQIASGTPFWKLQAPTDFYSDQTGVQLLAKQIFFNSEALKSFYKASIEPNSITRIGYILNAVLDVNINWNAGMALPSILGEYIQLKTQIDNLEYGVIVEKISQDPPIISFRIHGPGFTIETKTGIFGGRKDMSFGINAVEMSLEHVIIKMKTKFGVFEWCYPSHRIQGLVYGKKESGVNGTMWIKDPTGISFKGSVSLGDKVTGKIYDKDGTVLEQVQGDLKDGLKFDKGFWTKHLGMKDLKFEIPDSCKNDEYYVDNIWKEVFKYMRQDHPDYQKAEQERHLVNQKERYWKGSKFGFHT